MNQTVARALREATELLQKSGITNARRDANVLLKHVLKKNLTYLIAHDDELLSEAHSRSFFSFVKRRAEGEPLQHLTGTQDFFGLEFEVNENVLIPRPETELLVEIAVEILRPPQQHIAPTFCDVGTGSGCVSIAILKNLAKTATGTALDISRPALKVAERNAKKHDVWEKLAFFQSNVFSIFRNPESGIQNPQFSLIVSNPPYISLADLPDLPREVRDYEPHSALFAGSDGFDVIRQLLIEAPSYLIANGYLLFEIGFGQSERVKELIDDRIWRCCEIRSDLQNIPRIVVLAKKC